MMKKLLITGFDPFGDYTMNPSWEAVQALPDVIGNLKLTKLMLPNIYGLEGRMVLEKAAEMQPDYILMTGMNSGSRRIILNAAALNLRDALLADNMGRQPWHEPVVAGAPAAYFSTIDVHRIYKKLRVEKLPVELGYSAGGYVCNDVFYTVLHHFADTEVKAGFVHVPIMPRMVWDDSIARPLEETIEVLTRVIEEIED